MKTNRALSAHCFALAVAIAIFHRQPWDTVMTLCVSAIVIPGVAGLIIIAIQRRRATR